MSTYKYIHTILLNVARKFPQHYVIVHRNLTTFLPFLSYLYIHASA